MKHCHENAATVTYYTCTTGDTLAALPLFFFFSFYSRQCLVIKSSVAPLTLPQLIGPHLSRPLAVNVVITASYQCTFGFSARRGSAEKAHYLLPFCPLNYPP